MGLSYLKIFQYFIITFLLLLFIILFYFLCKGVLNTSIFYKYYHSALYWSIIYTLHAKCMTRFVYLEFGEMGEQSTVRPLESSLLAAYFT